MIRAPASVARALERGHLSSPATRWLGGVWARHARPVRPLALPELANVIGIGGPTLGGSYKTPLVLALSRALRAAGMDVAVVVHGYGARIPEARRVSVRDEARAVGDDAAWLARDLAADGVPVFVGPRARSVELAVSGGRAVLVDGLLQASPRRLGCSLLTVDGEAPWGAGACPPAGDLRAPERTLLAAADAVVAVVPGSAPRALETLSRATADADRALFVVVSTLEATEASSGAPVNLASLSGVGVGVVTAIARPDRFVRALAAAGLAPAAVRHFGDHDRPRAGRSRRPAPRVEAWLTTAKCATKLGATYDGAGVIVVRQRLVIPEALVASLAELRLRRRRD